MAKGIFEKPFYGPDNKLYDKGEQNVPDAWVAENANVLPKSFKLTTETDVKEPAPKKATK